MAPQHIFTLVSGIMGSKPEVVKKETAPEIENREGQEKEQETTSQKAARQARGRAAYQEVFGESSPEPETKQMEGFKFEMFGKTPRSGTAEGAAVESREELMPLATDSEMQAFFVES